MTTRRLIKIGNKYEWLEIEHHPRSNSQTRMVHFSGKDPTVDQYISEKGAIFNHADKKYYTTKRSYMDSLKSMGKAIDDN